MSLRVRLAILFALVALVSAAAVVASAPVIVSRAFAQITADAGATPGPGAGRGPGGLMGQHTLQVQQDAILTIVLIALGGAAVASLLGFLLARRITRPLDRLGDAASAVARGDLARRSGLGDRGDEIGSLGRSFDTMAASLEQAEAARRRFFQDAAHELKTPLAVITATTNAVLDGVYQHDDRHLETIRDQSRLLARLVDDLRTISQAEEGGLPLATEVLDVAQLLDQAAGSFAGRAAQAGLRITTSTAGPLAVRGDPDRLRQVLAALLDNAVRVTPSGGLIELEAGVVGSSAAAGSRDSVGGGRVRIAVRDSGPGVPGEHLPHLFERFYQADPARDRASGTSGLGLAIVRALVEAHGGTVGAESGPGGGAAFWLELPRA